jgi:DNA invertase Pin-like site-specific DNA recombinase
VTDCRADEVDVIVVYKWDRFARSLLAGLNEVADLEHRSPVVACPP